MVLLKTQCKIIILSMISVHCQCKRNDTKRQTNYKNAQSKIIYELEKQMEVLEY